MESWKTPSPPEPRPRGLAQEIVDTLVANIKDGSIKPGDKLPSESEIMGHFAVSLTDTNLNTVETSLHAFRSAIQQDSDAVPSDFEFHMEVARARGNQHFADLMAYLMRVHSEHESIFVAIRDQDAEAARAAMRTHLANSRERLRKAQLNPA